MNDPTTEPRCVTCGYYVPTIGDQCETCATGGTAGIDASTVSSIPAGGPDETASSTTTDRTTGPTSKTTAPSTPTGTGPRADWLAWRRSGIGASDVAGILGLSPWASPYSVWLSKVTDTSDSEPTEAMEFGSRAEAMLARWFEDRTLHTIGGEQTWCTHPTEPWALCTVDGFIFDGPNADSLDDAVAVAEWKTTGDTVAEWADKVPNHYACQATWTMYVTGFPAVYFGVLHLAYGRPAFRVYEFHRDADDEAFVVEWCRRFWYEQVVAGVPPGIDNHEATTKALKDQWPEGHGGTKEADLDAIELVEECLYHRAQVKAAEADQQQADNRLIALLGDDIELAAAGRTLATRKPQERTTVDTAALRKAWPDLVRDFEKTTTSRTLLVKKPKEK